jgi:rubredoxin
MSGRPLEIVCRACGAETFVRRMAVYEGFRKTAEKFACLACGFVYEREADVPFKARATPTIFTEQDRPKKVDVLRDEKDVRNCRRCRHYVVNPFTQRCGLHLRRVEATDLCDEFEPPEAPLPEVPE